jgi:hypothetical protein
MAALTLRAITACEKLQQRSPYSITSLARARTCRQDARKPDVTSL